MGSQSRSRAEVEVTAAEAGQKWMQPWAETRQQSRSRDSTRSRAEVEAAVGSRAGGSRLLYLRCTFALPSRYLRPTFTLP